MTQTIIIADDHPLFRSALEVALTQILPAAQFYEAGTIPHLQTLLGEIESPDIIFLDLQMPGAHGFSSLIFLKSHYPDIPVIIISAHNAPKIIQKSIHFGASGFIPKTVSLSIIRKAIEQIQSGNVWVPYDINYKDIGNDDSHNIASRLSTLTPQQFRVLSMISDGMLNKQIAYDLDVSEATIKAHVTAIFKKLNVRSRTQAVIAIKPLEIDIPDDPL
ncbi:Transcriptional regulatory protein DegU [invertebrate metagenome]|uniref:Transcriptional regulatory protein DegU n=1 Tax=invertebrate metagenome TaxID=1711999 RepID=A0A2H9TB43_9ZZZZ